MSVTQRPATRDDLDAVLALWIDFDTAVRGFPDSDAADVTGDWDAPGFDLEKHTLLLEDGPEVVGYALVHETEVDSTVHPSRFGQGLEERLLGWIEGAVAPGTTVQHVVPSVLGDLPALFSGRGWQATTTYWRMRIDHDAPAVPPLWPERVVVRDLEPDRDARAVHALVQTAFADIGGEVERSFEQWSLGVLDPARFLAPLCLVAERDGELVGALVSQDLEDYGFVRQLAVPRALRGQGLGRALLLESFIRHRDRGLSQTQLGVNASNRTGATALYESVGMRVTEEFTRWEITV